MKTDIKSVHFDIKEPTKEFLDKKLSKINYAEKIVEDLHITLTKEKSSYTAEVNVHTHWKELFHIKEDGKDLIEAIEKLFDKLDYKLSKEKQKIQNHHKEKPEQI
ncbi:ribosome-associated translation inhibitor RaiA [Spirochaetia bacterium 38H-sp]|uniref:Ribosome-associated translation inhibitor RaiA n=1 Tax=Rarispira pelagica TaxID=3141764 RepID=A0ABU9U9D3_9SPIR